jgi:hypothetical protein
MDSMETIVKTTAESTLTRSKGLALKHQLDKMVWPKRRSTKLSTPHLVMYRRSRDLSKISLVKFFRVRRPPQGDGMVLNALVIYGLWDASGTALNHFHSLNGIRTVSVRDLDESEELPNWQEFGHYVVEPWKKRLKWKGWKWDCVLFTDTIQLSSQGL